MWPSLSTCVGHHNIVSCGSEGVGKTAQREQALSQTPVGEGHSSEVLTLHVGPTSDPAPATPVSSARDQFSMDFIREISAELGVSPSRLEVIMRPT